MDNPAPASGSNTLNVNINTNASALGASQDSGRVTIDQLLMAGAHFGHLTQRWNPKMKSYIFMARNGIYLIDLQKTQSCIEKACKELARMAAAGGDILFVGTKPQAREIVAEEAARGRCPYVTHRWLGGMLTNFATIRRSLKTLESYEQMESDGTFEKITKKEQLTIRNEREKLNRILGGIREMKRLPAALFVVDTGRESIAVAEARKLEIPIFAIVDTNVDPELVNFPIPANDDAFKSIWLICKTAVDAIMEGKSAAEEAVSRPRKEITAEEAAERPKPRRSRRRRKPRRRAAQEGETTGAAGAAEVSDTTGASEQTEDQGE